MCESHRNTDYEYDIATDTETDTDNTIATDTA